MNLGEKLAILIFLVILLPIVIVYLIKSHPKKEKKVEDKKVEDKKEEEKLPLKPIAILKEDVKLDKVDKQDIAPLRKDENKIESTKKTEVKTNKSIAEQIEELSPEMKALLASDILKPKY